MAEPGLSAKHHEWVSDTLGVDPSTYPDQSGHNAPPVEPAPNGNPSAPPAATSDAQAPPPSAASPGKANVGQMVVPVEKTITLPGVELKGSYCKVSLNLAIKLKGSVTLGSGEKGSSSTDISPIGYSDGLVIKLGETWYHQQGVRIFGVEEAIAETQLVGQMKVKDGVEFSFAGKAKWKNGEELQLKFTVVKLDTEGDVSGPAAEVSYTAKALTIKFPEKGSVVFGGSVQLLVVGKCQPNYAAIATMVGERAAASGVGARVTQMLAGALTADALIAAGLIVGAIATIAGGVKAMADGAEIRGLHPIVEKTTLALRDGFIAGAKAGSPPGDPLGMPGYTMGQRGFAALKDHVLKTVPDATDDEVRDVAGQILQGHEGEVWTAMNPHAKEGVWEAYATGHSGFFDSKEDLKFAYSNIFGRLPGPSDKNYMDFYNK